MPTIEEDKQVKPGKSNDGWLGITDKYWAVALVPSAKQPFQPGYSYFADGRPRYQSDFITDPVAVAPGADRRPSRRRCLPAPRRSTRSRLTRPTAISASSTF